MMIGTNYPIGAPPLRPFPDRQPCTAEPYQAMPDYSGIYGIYVIGAPGVYVGQAVNLKERWSEHVQMLRRGDSSNANLRLLSRLFPLSAFFCEPLTVYDNLFVPAVLSKIELDIREGAWVRAFKMMGVYIYNTATISAEDFDPERPERRLKGSLREYPGWMVQQTHCYRALDPLSNVGIEV